MADNNLNQSLLDKGKDNGDGAAQNGAGNFDELRDSLDRITDVWKNKMIPQKFLHMNSPEDTRAQWRKDLFEGLEHKYTHIFIVTLLLVDLLATAVDILKTIHNKTHDLDECAAMVEVCQCVDHFERSESWEFVYWISITILVVLAVNVILLFISCGLSFFRHAGYVLDAVVVSIALLLEIFLDTDTVGLLIILTLWRIVRVAHGIFEVTDEAWENEIKTFEQKLKEAEDQHKKDQDLLELKEKVITEFRKAGSQDDKNKVMEELRKVGKELHL